jgi:hypothetical protein
MATTGGNNMSWGTKTTEATVTKTGFDKDYYRGLFENNTAQSVPVRMALIGKENCAKTGTAISICRQVKPKGHIYVFDVDNSAKATIDSAYAGDDEITVLPLLDERDDSIFNDDATVNYANLIDKVNYFVNIVADKSKEGEDIAGIVFDGGSTFLKWCEFAMTDVLLRKGVIKEEGDSFNQKEWRTRNQLFRQVMTRLHGLAVPCVFFTFHLKDVSNYVDNGSGGKVLMKVGERPEWDKGTMRLFSQQIFLSRYMKRADTAAGVKADPTLKNDDDWIVKATFEEIKGKHMEHIGQTHTILEIIKGKVKWFGLPMLTWSE